MDKKPMVSGRQATTPSTATGHADTRGRRLRNDEQLLGALQQNPHDNRQRETLRRDLVDLLVGALMETIEDQPPHQTTCTRGRGFFGDVYLDDIVRHAEIAVDEFLDRFAIGGRWRPKEGLTLLESLLMMSTDAAAEREGDHEGDTISVSAMSVRRLVDDIPAASPVASLASALAASDPMALAVTFLLERGMETAAIARCLDLPEPVVACSAQRVRHRIDEALQTIDTAPEST